MLTSAFPSTTRMPGVVTASPGRSGTAATTALPAGVTRRTRVATCQVKPSESSRSTWRKGGRVVPIPSPGGIPSLACRVN